MIESNEVWLPVKSYESLYKISSFGRVFSYYSNKVLNPNINTSGYFFVNLFKDKKVNTKMIHQLVAESFLDHVPNGQAIVVDHINTLKLDNRVENLQCISQRDNSLKDKGKPKSGYQGVYWNSKNKKWQVRPRLKGVKFFVGYFDCPEYAHKVYKDFVHFVDNNDYSIEDLKEKKEYYKRQIKAL